MMIEVALLNTTRSSRSTGELTVLSFSYLIWVYKANFLHNFLAFDVLLILTCDGFETILILFQTFTANPKTSSWRLRRRKNPKRISQARSTTFWLSCSRRCGMWCCPTRTSSVTQWCSWIRLDKVLIYFEGNSEVWHEQKIKFWWSSRQKLKILLKSIFSNLWRISHKFQSIFK